MLEPIRGVARFLKLHYYLLRCGVSMSETSTHIQLKKGENRVTLSKDATFLENYVRIIAAASWLNVSGETKERKVDDGWDCIVYPYHGWEINLAYPSGDREKAFFDVFFLQNEFATYLEEYSPKNGDVVIDAGAYHGIFSVIMSKMVGAGGRVICLEPDQDNLEILKKNLELNGCSNVTTSQKALWNGKTSLTFNSQGTVSSTLFCQSDGPEKEKSKPAKKVTVETTSIRDILEEFRLDKIDFIKMDIEGAEIEALDGCAQIIASQDMKFSIAGYHFRDGQPTFRKVEKILRGFGYKVRTGYPHLTTYAWKPRSSKPE
ncbi:MAG: FkbM family methyltransferase [Candidatus Micrarchaeota archaeon]